MVYLFLFFLVFVVALLTYKGRKVKWNESFLRPEEKVLYEQPKTTLYTVRSEKDKRGMAWLNVKLTNQRIFFLYPDKKGITKILDFTSKTETNAGVLENVTIYIDKQNIKIENDVLGRGVFQTRGTNSLGYEFKVAHPQKVKEILAI